MFLVDVRQRRVVVVVVIVVVVVVIVVVVAVVCRSLAFRRRSQGRRARALRGERRLELPFEHLVHVAIEAARKQRLPDRLGARGARGACRGVVE